MVMKWHNWKEIPTKWENLKRTDAVGSASDFGPRGPRFDPRQGRRLLWP